MCWIILGHMHNGDGITIAELAATTALGTATLRAGRDGLDRSARRVQWMEVLDDYADYLAEGDLLLTTAYNLRDDAELQRELARRLVECGVAAMVVKCGYYLEQVPHIVRRQADRHGLPVFELPREVAFVEISQSIYERLVSRSYARLRRSADIHRELVRLAAEGARLPRIVRRAAALLGNPVLVEDARGRPLAGFLPSGEPLADPRPDAALAAPVVARGMLHGRVLLFGERAPADDDAQALEQVATVVALEITRSDRELRAEREQLAAFVRDLVGGVLTPEDAQREAAVLGVELPPAPAVAVLEGRRSLTGLDLVRHEAGRTVAVVPAGSQLDAAGGIAPSEDGVAGLPGALVRAERAWRLGAALAGPGRLHRYADVETYDALVGHLRGPELDRLRDRTLAPLPAPLRDTLAAYVRCGGSVARTAEALYVHRNTVRYRLRRVEQLTELDLRRPEDRLLCELVLLAERVEAASG
jgi:PucR family transcriptional regulator, purine catabolism regulatory protein